MAKKDLKTQRQKKGIFCLEGHWEGVKDETTVEPMLTLLRTLAGYKVPYRHYDVGTFAELDLYLSKWRSASFSNFPILYLGFHGEAGKLHVQEGRNSAPITLEDLAARLEGACRGRVVHLGACGTVAVHGRRLKGFLTQTGALAVCGYTTPVYWLESAAFETLVLGGLQRVSFRRASSMRKFDQALRQQAPGLYKRLGFRMECPD